MATKYQSNSIHNRLP